MATKDWLNRNRISAYCHYFEDIFNDFCQFQVKLLFSDKLFDQSGNLLQPVPI